LVHGLTAYPGSQRYADWYESQDDTETLAEAKPVHRHDFRRMVGQPALGTKDDT
jgi:hypothetical protein